MAEQYFELPLRSVGSISAPGIASESTLQLILDELETKTPVDYLSFDYSSDNVDESAWVEVIPSTADEINEMTWFDSCGRAMEVGLGVVPARLFVAPPGGFNGVIPCPIPSGTKVSIRCLESVLVQEGMIVANFYK